MTFTIHLKINHQIGILHLLFYRIDLAHSHQQGDPIKIMDQCIEEALLTVTLNYIKAQIQLQVFEWPHCNSLSREIMMGRISQIYRQRLEPNRRNLIFWMRCIQIWRGNLIMLSRREMNDQPHQMIFQWKEVWRTGAGNSD